MARKHDSNKQRDEGVLRAKDVMPPYDGDVTKAQDVQKTERVPLANKEPAAADKPSQDRKEIPKFDLADEILAEQRKSTARRRKRPAVSAREAPGRIEATSRQPQAKPVSSAIGPPSPILSEQEQIIAEIVARDIEKLRQRRGNGE